MPLSPRLEPPAIASGSSKSSSGSSSCTSSSTSNNNNSNHDNINNDDSSSSRSDTDGEEKMVNFNSVGCEEFTKFFLCKQSPTGDCLFAFGAYPPRGDGRVVPPEVADVRYGGTGERQRHRALCPVSVTSWRHAPTAIL